jgi:hypothetical protein
VVTGEFDVGTSFCNGLFVRVGEITGIQREAGTTASPVEEYWTRREGI